MSVSKRVTSGLGVLAAGAATILFLVPCPSSADDESAVVGDLVIDQVAATPARTGETTRITFLIENSGSQGVTITGIRLPSGEPSRVVGFYGTSHSGDIGAFPVAPGEMARLDGKKAWIEVGPLKQDLGPDVVVSARLVLGPYEAPISIHVSTAPRDGTQRVNQTDPGSRPSRSVTNGSTRLWSVKC